MLGKSVCVRGEELLCTPKGNVSGEKHARVRGEESGVLNRPCEWGRKWGHRT